MFTTKANGELEKAKQSTQKALRAVSEIIITRCNGWDDYTSEYREKLREALLLLMDAMEKIGP